MTAAPPARWVYSFDEPARLWTLELADDVPVDVEVRAYDRLSLDCTDLLILARTRWTRYEVSIAPPELIGRRVDDLILTFVATWAPTSKETVMSDSTDTPDTAPAAEQERDAPTCPGCGAPAAWGDPDPSGLDVVDCPSCERRTAIGFV